MSAERIAEQTRQSLDDLMSSLSADVHLLGNLLGMVIREQHGNDAFNLVEAVRASAKARRAGDEAAADRLRDIIAGITLAERHILIKAFSNYFQLINIAEDLQRIRVLRRREREGRLHESIDAAIRQLHEAGASADDVRGVLRQARLRLVLTAHPSEAKRKEVLVKLRHIAQMMADRDRQALLPREETALEAALLEEIEELWQTRPTRSTRTTVLDEVDFGVYFITSVIMDVVVEIYAELRATLTAYYPGEDWSTLPPFLRFASWIGGDRDGNPNVTPEVTLETLAILKRAARQIYLSEVAFLRDHLTQSADEFGASQALRASVAGDEEAQRRYPGEVYRQKMCIVERRLEADGYATGDDLLQDLLLVHDSLHTHRGRFVAEGALQRLIEKVRLFGLHLVPLDVREDARLHIAALDELFRQYGLANHYAGMPEDAREALLTREIANPRPLFPSEPRFSGPANLTINTWRMTAEAHRRYGPVVIDSAIASMSKEASDVLAMLLFASEVGIADDLDIVPLFETIDDLNHASAVMTALFANPEYRRHLEKRGMHQQIMIGYSDSSKDGGYLASNWGLYTAQEKLVETCVAAGVSLELFHGRGGSIGRGGGPTNRAILAQPPESIRGGVKITEQGEVIAYRYSNAEIARRHLHQVLNAVFLAIGAPREAHVRAEWRAAMNQLAAIGRRAYREFVYETPDFLDYWQQATPINELSHMTISSRPAKRRKQGGFADIRAIPWVFSWMQSRAIIPSWYGVGRALEAFCAENPGGLDVLREMVHHWSFFKALIENTQLDLAKADMGIAGQYALLVKDSQKRAAIFEQIQREHALACGHIGLILRQADILENMPVIQRSIERRNPYVDPLNFIQVALLDELRRLPPETAEHEAILEAILYTVNGIAAGMKTTG